MREGKPPIVSKVRMLFPKRIECLRMCTEIGEQIGETSPSYLKLYSSSISAARS